MWDAKGPNMDRPLGVILAGGLARRMGGGDKSLLSLGASSRVLDLVIARLGAHVDQMVLNANGDPARFDEFGLPVFLWRPIPRFFQPIWFRHLILHQSIWMYQSHLPRQKLRVEKQCVTQPLGCGLLPCARICDPPCRMDCARLFCGRISMVRKLIFLTAAKSTRFLTSTHQKIWSWGIK